MKKILFAAASVAVIGAASVTYAFSQKSQNDLSDLQLTAIEVLSGDDNPGGDGDACYNTITSAKGRKVRYCPTCEFVDGKDVWYSFASTCRK